MTPQAEQTAAILEQVIDTVDRIEDQTPDTYLKGEDFLDDVRSKAEDMLTGIEERETATDRQQQTANNWLSGVSKWDRT